MKINMISNRDLRLIGQKQTFKIFTYTHTHTHTLEIGAFKTVNNL